MVMPTSREVKHRKSSQTWSRPRVSFRVRFGPIGRLASAGALWQPSSSPDVETPVRGFSTQTRGFVPDTKPNYASGKSKAKAQHW